MARPRRRTAAKPIAGVGAAEVEAAQVLSSMASGSTAVELEPDSGPSTTTALTPAVLAALEELLGKKAIPGNNSRNELGTGAGVGSSKVHDTDQGPTEDEDDEDDVDDDDDDEELRSQVSLSDYNSPSELV